MQDGYTRGLMQLTDGYTRGLMQDGYTRGLMQDGYTRGLMQLTMHLQGRRSTCAPQRGRPASCTCSQTRTSWGEGRQEWPLEERSRMLQTGLELHRGRAMG